MKHVVFVHKSRSFSHQSIKLSIYRLNATSCRYLLNVSLCENFKKRFMPFSLFANSIGQAAGRQVGG